MSIVISPEVALEEARAESAWLRQRCLVLRQALHESETARKAAEQERDDLLAEQQAEEPMEPEA